MVNKTAVVLCVICVVLAVGLAGTLMLLTQKEAELQVKTNQVSDLENEKLSLTYQVSVLETYVSGLQSEVTTLESEKSILVAQVSPLQTQVSGLQAEVTALETEKDTLEQQVSVMVTNVSSLQGEVTTLEGEKSVLVAEVSGLQAEVTLLESDKNVLQQQVLGLQNNVESLQIQVTSLETEKSFLEIQVSSLVTQVANLEDEVIISYDEGYAQGTEDLIQTSYYSADPTYDQAIAFIETDEVDKNPYTPEYVCYDFTADFISNAALEGYRCGFVYIEFDSSAHAIACFNTTDAGLIFVEPQNDQIVDVAVGQFYLSHLITKMGIIW